MSNQQAPLIREDLTSIPVVDGLEQSLNKQPFGGTTDLLNRSVHNTQSTLSVKTGSKDGTIIQIITFSSAGLRTLFPTLSSDFTNYLYHKVNQFKIIVSQTGEISKANAMLSLVYVPGDFPVPPDKPAELIKMIANTESNNKFKARNGAEYTLSSDQLKPLNLFSAWVPRGSTSTGAASLGRLILSLDGVPLTDVDLTLKITMHMDISFSHCIGAPTTTTTTYEGVPLIALNRSTRAGIYYTSLGTLNAYFVTDLKDLGLPNTNVHGGSFSINPLIDFHLIISDSEQPSIRSKINGQLSNGNFLIRTNEDGVQSLVISVPDLIRGSRRIDVPKLDSYILNHKEDVIRGNVTYVTNEEKPNFFVAQDEYSKLESVLDYEDQLINAIITLENLKG